MINITCDRCGANITAPLPWAQAKFPLLMITIKESYQEQPHTIDLCDNCQKEFLFHFYSSYTSMAGDSK